MNALIGGYAAQQAASVPTSPEQIVLALLIGTFLLVPIALACAHYATTYSLRRWPPKK